MVKKMVKGESIAAANSSGTEPPVFPVPEGAVDCHMHIFDPKYAFIPGRSPGIGTVEQYEQFQKRLGLTRCIVVAPSSYGLDNSCLIDTLEYLGTQARGVATINEDTSMDELHMLHSKGVRGVRMNYGRAVPEPTKIVAIAEKIFPLNWHLQTHMHADAILEHESILESLPTTLVIDHIGRAPQPGGLSHPVAKALQRLLNKGNTYIKISHYYENDNVSYDDYAPLIKHLINIAPEQLLWASDWPHGTQANKPDDAKALDKLAEWCPTEEIREKILVHNPQKLYWRD